MKSLFLVALCAIGIGQLSAQNVLFVKSGVTNGDIITEGGVSGAAYTTPQAAISASAVGDTIRFTEDYTATSSVSITNRVLDGNNHTLTASGTYSYPVVIRGGTVMNLKIRRTTVTGRIISIQSKPIQGDVIIDNCDIDDGTYGIHRDDVSNPKVALIIRNSTIRCWSSWSDAFDPVIITNCTFAKGSSGYAHLRPYGSAVVENCSFSSDFSVSTTNGPIADNAIIFNNCDIAGTPLTSDNLNSLLENHNQEASNQKGVVVDGSFSQNASGEITGGTFGGNPQSINSMCAEGYGALALGTTPETYQVTPVYFIHYNNNGGTGTMADSYVARTSPTFTVPASTFTNGDWTFAGWNTKADGTGTALAVDATMTLSSDTTLYAQWRGVAKIGDVHYVTLDAAVDAVQANETIEILADSCGITNTKVIPAGVTITGQGKTNTIMTIASTSGSGLTLNNANVTLRDMTIDGSQITSGGYKCLVNVRADGCLITDVVMKKGGTSTWNSSILVEALNSSQTFTVRNSTISGSFRGVLRESCNANIVIDNCDIDAVYPFNIDGGSGGVITVTNSGLHGWTSYSGVESVTFTNCDFSKATSGYDIVAAYVNTTFDNCTMDNNFQIYAQTSGFEFTLEDCEKNGTLITNENFTDFFTDSDVWNKCLTTVNEVSLVSKQAQVTEVLTGATTDKYAKMTKSFEYDGALCGPASDKTLNLNCNDSTLIMKNNGTQIASLTSAGGKYTLEYACENGSIVSLTNASVAISEGTAFTVTDQTTFFKAADGYFLVETDNGGSFTYSVGTLADKVACIGDGSLGTQYFTTLADAVTAAAAATDTIVILQDIADLPQQTIDKNISINLNNHTISGSTQKLINITAGDVTIKNGNITSTVAKMIYLNGSCVLTVKDCNFSTTGAGQVVFVDAGTVNANSSVISSTGNATVLYNKGTFNASNCTIRTSGTDATVMNSGTASAYFENCTVSTEGPCAINNTSTSVVNVNGGTVTSNGCQASSPGPLFTINCQDGTVNIYGDAVITTCCRAIMSNPQPDYPDYDLTRHPVVNFGGYEEGGNLVASGAPTIRLKDDANPAGEKNLIDVYYGTGTVRVFGDASIEGNKDFVESAIAVINGGNVEITGGTIEAKNTVITTGLWTGDASSYHGYPNTVFIHDTALLISTTNAPTVTIQHNDSYVSEVEIWGGVFSDDVSGEKCRDGYAAFPLESNPGYFYVAPSYAIFLMANNGTTDKDTCYVRQTTGSGVLKANAFVHPSALTFSRWNTKADASGNDFNNRATITGITHDTTLYAIWTGEVAKIDGTPYASLQAAVTAASAMTGDVTIELVDNTSESVLIRQQDGLNITIDGANHTVTGQIIIDGMGGSTNTETLLIENVNFVYDANYIDEKTDAFVIMPNAKDASASWFTLPDHYNYAHHVTVQNCTFDGEGSNNGIVGVKVPSQGAYDVTVDHCTASNMHSLAQFNSTEGVAITNCTATDNVKNGANIVGGGGTITVTNNEITTLTGGDQYGIRIKGGSTGDKDVTLADNTVEAPVAIVLANTVPDHTTINVTGGTYIGDIDDSDNGETFNITGGTFSEDVSGEPCAEGYAAFANGTTPETWTVGQYKVRYFSNNSIDTVKIVALGTETFPLTFNLDANIFTMPDSVFVNWNTQPDGSGTSYSNEQEVTIDEGLTLYAQWGLIVAKNVNTDTYYASLQTAVDGVNADDTVRILRNIELGNGENVNITKTLTLDLNGDTIKIEQFKVDNTYKDWFGALQVKGGDLTIKDSRENGAVIATVPSTAANNQKMGSAIWVTENGNLTLNSGTICGYKFGVYVGTDHAPVNSTATINGGNVTTYGYSGAYSVYNKGTLVTINDGATIIGDTVVYSGYGVFGFSSSSYGQSITTINGGYFRASSIISNLGGSITIEDGTFISGRSSGSYNLAQNSSGGNITINGGTFYVAKNRGFKNDPNSTLTFNGGTIVDRGVTYDIIYNKGTVVLNDIELSCHDCDYTIWVDEGGVLEIHNGRIENTNTDQSALIYCKDGDAKITIDGTELVGTAANTFGIWEVGPNVDIAMTSGSINTSKYCIVNNGTYTSSTSKWIIEGGTITSSGYPAIFHAAPDSVIIGIDCDNGPTITGVDAAIEHRAGHLVIKGGTLTATTTEPYSCHSEGSGTTTTGAAVAVAQHNTTPTSPTTVDISCGTFEGEASISIANPEGITTDNVEASITGGTFTGEVVTTDTRIDDYITGGTFDDATVLAELNNRIEPGYTAFDNGNNTYTVAKAYVLIYNANGGTGTMDTVVVQEANKVQTVLPCAFTFGTMPFINWNTVADGTGTPYNPVSNNIELVNPDTTILYAQWDGVAKIGARSYPTLQAAVDAANASMTGDVTIDLVKNTSEIVTILQKDEISLTINGNDNTLTGQIFIGGRQETPAYVGTHTAPNTITIDNLNMNYDPAYYNNYGSTDESGLIYFCKNCAFGSVLNYSHNVTISNCDFDADGSNKGVYAISSIAGSVFNLNIENCTAKNALGLATLQSAPEFEVTNCSTEDVTYGLRIVNNNGPMNITGNNFTADEAGFFVTGMTTGATINFANDTVNAPNAFQLASSCTSGNLEITSGLYMGDFDDNATSDFFNISGGTYSVDVTGEPCAEGYAAFANGTTPETWTVDKAWFLYYNKNEVEASGTMDTIFVRRSGDDAARTVSVSSCEFTWLPYHTFDKWNNKAGGDGNDFAPGDNITLTSDTTLFALWKLGYTVFYHNNGGTGTIPNQSKDPGVDIVLSDGTGFSKPDSTLYRWNTQADESGTPYALGATYSEDANLDLYAVWRLNLGMTSSATDVVCFGQNNGTDTVKIIGGEAPYQIVLSGGALTGNEEITTDQTQYIFTNLKPSTNEYKVWVTDVLAKDTIRAAFTISEPDELLITSLTVPVAPCPLMGSGTYPVSMTTTGGNGGNVITWGGDVTDADALSSTITPDADDRDRTYTVTVTVTDSKNCSATETTTFAVSPVISNDGSAHSNTTMTIENISKMIKDGCDTVIRNFGTPAFAFTNAAITEGILDTIYNNVPTVAPDSVFAAGTTTVITWTAVDTCGHEVTATQEITIAYAPCPSVEDFDHNVYPSVRIGCDCWTAKNLSSTHYSDGREIQNVMHYPVNSRATVGGNLYDWYATMDTTTNGLTDIEAACASPTGTIQGICPEGWHVPTQAELDDMMGSANTEDLMSVGVWIPNVGTNVTGFDMYPAGCYNSELDRYERMYVSAYFWILTPPSAVYHACEFGAACSTTEIIPGTLTMGFSVRCVLDKSDE